MSIQVRCQCGQLLDAPAEAAGHKVRCPVCREPVSVPEPTRRRRSGRTPSPQPDADLDHSTSKRPRRTPKQRKRRQESHTSDVPKSLPPKQAPTRGPNVFRPTEERAISVPEKRRKKKPKQPAADSSDLGFITSLMFPFRTEAMLTICVMTFLYTCIMVPMQFLHLPMMMMSPRMIVGVLFVMMLIQGYFWHFLFEVLRMAAYNEQDLPMSAAWEPENIFYDLVIAAGATLVSFFPLIAGVFLFCFQFIADHPFIATLLIGIGLLYLPMAMIQAVSTAYIWVPAMVESATSSPLSLVIHLILAALIALPCLYLPMALMASVLHQSVRAAFPWYVIPAMVRMPWAYLETLVLVIGVAGLTVFLQFLANYIPVLGVFLVWFLVFTGNTAIMHRLGAMYYENRHALGWFPDGPRVY
ncbi:MAG: hypothetical protein R3B91_02355 [Planctomycetaceae bacterium]